MQCSRILFSTLRAILDSQVFDENIETWSRFGSVKNIGNLSRLARWGLERPSSPRGSQKRPHDGIHWDSDMSPSPKLRDVIIDDPAPCTTICSNFWPCSSWQKANWSTVIFHRTTSCGTKAGPASLMLVKRVVESHPKAQEFLVRDVTRLVEWGQKNQLERGPCRSHVRSP